MPRPLPQADLEFVHEHTRALWQQLRGQRIFLTGATGFFGAWLLESFAYAQSHEVLDAEATVLTRDAQAFARRFPHLADNSAIRLCEGDVRSFAFPDGDFPVVVHAATESFSRSGEPHDPVELFSTIVDGTSHVLDFAASHGTRRLLYVSSGAVYGRQPSALTHVDENFNGAPDPLAPGSEYGEGKRAAEALCAAYNHHHTIECMIARCFAFVGPQLPLDKHFAIGNFIRNALDGGPISIAGDGTPHRSYLYAADLAIWLWTILLEGQPRRAYNVGSDESLSISQLAQRTAAALAPGCRIDIKGKAVHGAPVARYVPSTERARTELGLRQRIALDEAIRRTAEWHRSQISD